MFQPVRYVLAFDKILGFRVWKRFYGNTSNDSVCYVWTANGLDPISLLL